MEIVTISQIVERLRQLPPAKLAVVFDFVSYLAEREMAAVEAEPVPDTDPLPMERPPDTLEWLEEWYLSQCDGDWEHGWGVKIQTIDNPGWSLKINLAGTTVRDPRMGPYIHDRGDHDWVSCEVKEGVFEGRGDARKLAFILDMFRRLVTPP